jgi:hypothetical protein
MVSWMHDADPQSIASDEVRIETTHAYTYLRSGVILRNGLTIGRVVAIYVDVCSLLEPRPSVRWDERSSELIPDDYLITRLTRRGPKDLDQIPAGVLLGAVLNRVAVTSSLEEAAPEIEFDPIAANIDALLDGHVRTGLLTFLRCAEISSSKQFAYREIWGMVVRALVGDTPELIAGEDLRALLVRLQPKSDDSDIERFRSFQRLAALRYSQALVGEGEDDAPRGVRSNAVTKLLWSMDPARDALPGRLRPQAWDSGWATPVVDAFSGPIVASSPLDSLLDELGDDDCMHYAVQDFDRELDTAFVSATRSPLVDTPTRQEMFAWYGAYLLRLYALANGISAFRSEVAVWTQAWREAPSLPDSLDRTLTTLLRPKRDPSDPSSSVLLPLFDSRTHPIVGFQSNPRLALKSQGVEMQTVCDGESLFLNLSENSKIVGRIELDFPLVRESLACSMEHVGLTEHTSVASPRLERFRAARLSPPLLVGAKYRLVSGTHEYTFTVEG